MIVRPVFAATALLALMAPPTGAQAQGYETPPGFRGIKWGDPPYALGPRGAPKIEKGRKRTECFTRQGDRLELAGVPLREVAYCFYRNHFYAVRVHAQSSDANTRKLASAIRKAYGEPESEVEGILYRWGGDDDAVGIFLASGVRLLWLLITHSATLQELNDLDKSDARDDFEAPPSRSNQPRTAK